MDNTTTQFPLSANFSAKDVASEQNQSGYNIDPVTLARAWGKAAEQQLTGVSLDLMVPAAYVDADSTEDSDTIIAALNAAWDLLDLDALHVEPAAN